MRKIFLLGLAGIATSAFLLMAGAHAADETPPDRAAIEKIVREYLIANPEVLVEAQRALEAKQAEEQRVAQRAVISGASDEIFNATYDGIYGNPEGSVTVVEFFDYNCGYCKRAMEDMEAMTAADPDLRFVLKEFPILGPDSQKSHVVSMAFRSLMPEKYGEFHTRLLGGAGRATEDAAIKIALALGADEAALRVAMKDGSIQDAFAKTYELANKLSISGTPSYVVGEEVVFGALGQDVLTEKVTTARQ